MSAQNRAVLFSRRGEKWPLCVCCVFLPTFMAAGCCVLLLPFVGAFLQCSLLRSWQIVCRGRFSAVQQQLRLYLSISSCFAPVNILLCGCCVWREIPVKHRSWSESMNHAWTWAGNTLFSLWFCNFWVDTTTLQVLCSQCVLIHLCWEWCFYTKLTYFLCSLFLYLLFPPCSGLVDALRCLQWLLWLACLSVSDYHSLDSVGQELISRERHEHSHPSRGGHSRHLIPGHGCGLRVSNTASLHCSHLSFPLTSTFIALIHSYIPCKASSKVHALFNPFDSHPSLEAFNTLA